LSKKPKNRDGDIEVAWEKMLGLLAKKDSAGAGTFLAGLMREDIKLWNAIYWQTDVWLASYFSRGPMTKEEERLGMSRLEAGRVRFNLWLDRSQHGKEGWTTKDLKRIIHTLP